MTDQANAPAAVVSGDPKQVRSFLTFSFNSVYCLRVASSSQVFRMSLNKGNQSLASSVCSQTSAYRCQVALGHSSMF